MALAFGSTVTRLMGGEDAGGSPAGSEQDASKIRQRKTPRLRRVVLVRIREVGRDKVREVYAGMLAQNGEEGLRRGNLAVHLCGIVR